VEWICVQYDAQTIEQLGVKLATLEALLTGFGKTHRCVGIDVFFARSRLARGPFRSTIELTATAEGQEIIEPGEKEITKASLDRLSVSTRHRAGPT
jgi:hypothetical protein